MPCSVKRACGLDSSVASRRSFCVTLVSAAVVLLSCSLAKQAEYLSTQRYSLPCTNNFAAAGRTPGCEPPQGGTCFTLGLPSSAGAWFHGKADIQPTAAFSNSSVLASAAEPLSSTSV